jgi:hypothetical protein
MIGLIRKVTLGDRDVTVRELTTAETRALIAEFESAAEFAPDMLALHMQAETDADRLALRCLHRMTDLAIADLGELPFSAVTAVLQACQEVNAGFFRQLGVLLELTRMPTPAPRDAA